MELAIANQRDRFCMFRTYYPPVDGPIKLSRMAERAAIHRG